mmetsp:Transcript_147157/g.274087  ORF Transcript_147157/g.274087 Transcript_147157/m.274087 type:complete len:270 (-) Transcript_147157:172-981(-)
MGGLVSSALGHMLGKQETRIIMLGLDAAGKTTILYKLKLGEVRTTIPTIGMNIESVEYKSSMTKLVSMTVWDVGGRDKIRPLYRHFYKQGNALVFVVDSNDCDRIEDAREQLMDTLREEECRDWPVLIFANKQDLPKAMPTAEVADKLGLHKLRNRVWYIQGTCATAGEGLYEGLDWLSFTMGKSIPSHQKQVLQPQIQKKKHDVIGRSSKKAESPVLVADTESAADMEAVEREKRRDVIGWSSKHTESPESVADTESTADTEAVEQDA